jgi:hypothetical protein
MNKQQFIQSIKTANPEWNAQQIVSYANTPRTIPNPVNRPTVPKQVNFTAVSSQIVAADRVKIQNQLKGTYESLLTNINKGQVQDVGLDVENLIGSGLLSAETITILQSAIAEVIAGEPDPNWQPTVYQPPYADHGLTPVLLDEV